MEKNMIIPTGAGTFDSIKFHALITLRAVALRSIRDVVQSEGYTEVTTASLVNIAGSCEDPYASFTVTARKHGGYLSQSAQLQLEALTIQLKRKVFTVNSSFRAEDYIDPEKRKRTLSEFTLIELEAPTEKKTSEEALLDLIHLIERMIKKSVGEIIKQASDEIALLGGNLDYLERVVQLPFQRLTHEEARALLQKQLNKEIGVDLGISEERKILGHFGNIPTFVTHFPPEIKFFNMKRTADGKKTYSVDLLLPELGETVGGAVREEDGTKIKEYLDSSRIGTFLREQHINPLVPFGPYVRLFEHGAVPLRGGFGLGFERFVGFLIGSNDVLETIAYRTIQPDLEISMAEIRTHRHHGNYSVIGPVRLPLVLVDGKVVEFHHDGFRFPHGRYSALHVGNLQESKDVLVRISSHCQWAFFFDSRLCDCRWQLEEAKQRIAKEGQGLIIFAHDQNGKGIPLEDHWLIYAEGQRRGQELVVDAYEQLGFREDYRQYDDVVDILHYYGIRRIRLLTNNPQRKNFFEEKGVNVSIEGLEQPIHDHLKQEYKSKKHKLGHLLKVADFG